MNGNVNKVKRREAYLNVLEKTIAALDYYCNPDPGHNRINQSSGCKTYRYDVIVRSNISTTWNLEKLYQYVKSYPNKKLYTCWIGFTLSWLDEQGGINGNAYFGTGFIQGMGIIISRCFSIDDR